MTSTNGPPAKPGSLIHKNSETLRAVAMGMPEAWEDFPWGHSAFKVRKKVFLFMSAGAESLNISMKLTDSHFQALLLPFTEPTGYGLGKSGWVSASFKPKDRPPMALIAEWIEESYRAVALKTLVKRLDEQATGSGESGTGKSTPKKRAKKATRKAAAKKKTAKKRSKKTAKKVSKKTTRKAAKQSSKKATKTTAKKASRKTTRKRRAGKSSR